MVASSKQMAWKGEVDDPREVERELDAEATADHVLFVQVLAACRAVAITLTYDKTANALDRIWAKHGRPVSASFLRAALNPEGEKHSYFRYEWIHWFARQSGEVADLVLEVGGRGKPTKTAEEELRDLKEVIRQEYPNQAGKLIRKGAGR